MGSIQILYHYLSEGQRLWSATPKLILGSYLIIRSGGFETLGIGYASNQGVLERRFSRGARRSRRCRSDQISVTTVDKAICYPRSLLRSRNVISLFSRLRHRHCFVANQGDACTTFRSTRGWPRLGRAPAGSGKQIDAVSDVEAHGRHCKMNGEAADDGSFLCEPNILEDWKVGK